MLTRNDAKGENVSTYQQHLECKLELTSLVYLSINNHQECSWRQLSTSLVL